MNNTLTIERGGRISRTVIPLPYHAQDGFDHYAIGITGDATQVTLFGNGMTVIHNFFNPQRLPFPHERTTEEVFLAAVDEAERRYKETNNKCCPSCEVIS